MSDTHTLSYGKLAATLAGLLALTAATVAVAQVDFGAANIWVTLLIAACKSSLVLMFFMHLKYEHRSFMWAFIVTVFFAALIIAFLFWDIAYRTVEK